MGQKIKLQTLVEIFTK